MTAGKTKSSPLVQALDAANPSPSSSTSCSTSSSNYPSHLATALNYSYHTPHLGSAHGHTLPAVAGKQGSGYFASSESSLSGLPPSSSTFLGVSQPGFPASCFRVKGHGGMTGGITGTSAMPTPSSTATSTGESAANTNSYSNCLGPDWPDLGITLGQRGKTQSKLVPSVTTGGMAGGAGEGGVSGEGTSESGGYGTWKGSEGGSTVNSEEPSTTGEDY